MAAHLAALIRNGTERSVMAAVAHQANTTEASHCAALAERAATVLRAVREVLQFRSDPTNSSRQLGVVATSAVMLRQRLQGRAPLLPSALAACVCAATLAGCAPSPIGHDLTVADAAAPGSIQYSAVREATISEPIRPQKKARRDVQVTDSAKQHTKTNEWSLASKRAIPLPDPELLRPPIESNCELEGDPEFKANDPRRLDLEKQCYRDAATITRNRLLLLQTSVDKMIETITGTRLNNP
jgi:hypothetical protein